MNFRTRLWVITAALEIVQRSSYIHIGKLLFVSSTPSILWFDAVDLTWVFVVGNPLSRYNLHTLVCGWVGCWTLNNSKYFLVSFNWFLLKWLYNLPREGYVNWVCEREMVDRKGIVVLQVVGMVLISPWRCLIADSIRRRSYPEHNKTYTANTQKIPRKMPAPYKTLTE